jgi:hypothetical protein
VVLCQTFRRMMHHVVKIELICNLCEHSFQLDTFIEKSFYYSRLVVTSTPITGINMFPGDVLKSSLLWVLF